LLVALTVDFSRQHSPISCSDFERLTRKKRRAEQSNNQTNEIATAAGNNAHEFGKHEEEWIDEGIVSSFSRGRESISIKKCGELAVQD
jgi:hypothetical protein